MINEAVISIYEVSPSGSISLKAANVPFATLQWTRRVSTCGDFSVQIVGDFPLPWPGRYLLTRSDRKEVGIIEKVEYGEEGQEDPPTASGRFAECLLDRRSFGNEGGEVSGANWKQAVTAAFGSWPMPDAPKIVVGEGSESPTGSSYAIRASKTDTAMDAVYAVTAAHDSYPLLWFDWERGELVLDIVEGVDRTRSQSVRPVMVFSLEMATAQKASYSGDYSVACSKLIACALNGDQVIEADVDVPGFDQSTMWQATATEDVSSLCPEDPAAADVEEAGGLRAYDHLPALAVDVSELGDGYGITWDLADICEADIPQAGVSCSARIEEVREIVKKDDVTIEVSLGSKEISKVERALMRLR